jgi:hypothetical protein
MFMPKQNPCYPSNMSLLSPRASVDTCEGRKDLSLCQESNPKSSFVQATALSLPTMLNSRLRNYEGHHYIISKSKFSQNTTNLLSKWRHVSTQAVIIRPIIEPCLRYIKWKCTFGAPKCLQQQQQQQLHNFLHPPISSFLLGLSMPSPSCSQAPWIC